MQAIPTHGVIPRSIRNRACLLVKVPMRVCRNAKAGFGVFYHQKNFWLGVGVPRLLVNSFSTVVPALSIAPGGTAAYNVNPTKEKA